MPHTSSQIHTSPHLHILGCSHAPVHVTEAKLPQALLPQLKQVAQPQLPIRPRLLSQLPQVRSKGARKGCSTAPGAVAPAL